MKSKVPAKQSDEQLQTLATEIQEHFELGEKAYGTALEHARAIGERLIAAKDLAGHGKWKSWVEAKCDFSMDTAERFMKIHREWNLLNSAPVRNLGIKDAVAYIAAEKKKAKQDTRGTGGDKTEQPDVGHQAPKRSDAHDVVRDDGTANVIIVKATCPNCGCTEFDEDGDCAKCHEPDVVRKHGQVRAKPEVEVDEESETAVEDEPLSARDCYVDRAEADFFSPDEPLDEDAVDQLEVWLEMMERPLTLILEHAAVAALSENDPLRVGLSCLERAIEQVSADLARKRPIDANALEVA